MEFAKITNASGHEFIVAIHKAREMQMNWEILDFHPVEIEGGYNNVEKPATSLNEIEDNMAVVTGWKKSTK
jgi:hypothetical protein